MSLFTTFTSRGIQFPVSQTMQIELGLIGAITLMGIAVQLRVLKVLQRKLKEIKEEQRRREAENDNKAAEQFARLGEEIADWEKDHPTLGKHGRQDSDFSGTPLMKGSDGASTPGPDDRAFVRNRHQSGLSDFLAAVNPDEERGQRRSQSPGALPALDLGSDIQENVPRGFIANDVERADSTAGGDPEDIKRKEELLHEIQTIRRSIDLLKSESPQPSSSSNSRHPSLTSRRTLSYDLNTATLVGSSHLRPPRDARHRVQSMELSTLSATNVGDAIGRPTSAPLRDNDWDAYVRDRKLVQPPSGPSAPIQTTPIPLLSPTPRLTVPSAVQDALLRRQQRESMIDAPDGAPPALRTDSPRSIDGFGAHLVAPKMSHHRSSSYNTNPAPAPVTVLPPKRSAAAPPPQQPRTVTYEELTERHREKLRQLQAPLTQAENEHAEVEAAKARWERSKTSERQAVEKRQAERAAALAKETQRPRRSGETHGDGSGGKQRQHTRAASAEMLGIGAAPSTSRRMSTLKVEDWQRYQADTATAERRPANAEGHVRSRSGGVPFPAERRGSRGLPPN